VKTRLKTNFKVLAHVRTNRRTRTRKKERSELDGFSHENPDPILEV